MLQAACVYDKVLAQSWHLIVDENYNLPVIEKNCLIIENGVYQMKFTVVFNCILFIYIAYSNFTFFNGILILTVKCG